MKKYLLPFEITVVPFSSFNSKNRILMFLQSATYSSKFVSTKISRGSFNFYKVVSTQSATVIFEADSEFKDLFITS